MHLATGVPRTPVASHMSGRDWRSFALQAGMVVGVELSDEFARGLFAPQSAGLAQVNAQQVMDFESAHDLWIEPAVQSFAQHGHRVFGMAVNWSQIVPAVNTLYGPGHVLITLAFAIWLFCWRRALFAFVRNVFLITNALAVALYNLFPLAPPRLATGLQYDGHRFRFADTVFGTGSGMKLSFDEYAAMPSLHVAWALIVGITVAVAARPLAVRLAALAYPVLMTTTVIVSGNHYLADCLGAAAVLSVAAVLAAILQRLCTARRACRAHSRPGTLPVTRLSLAERRTSDQEPEIFRPHQRAS